MPLPLPTWRAAALFLAVLAAAPAPPRALAAALPPLPELSAPLGRDHPLTGTIRRADGSRATPAAMIEALARADFVLLGEKHDNPDHHRLQAWVIAALVAADRRPAVAFEMIGADQAEALARFLATPLPDPAGLGEAVGWPAGGWPDWPLYAPIARAALGAGLPIVAADLPRSVQRSISREGIAALDPATRPRFGLDAPYDASLAAALSDELQASHCGHLPASALPRMMDVQRARDASMAAALAAAAAQPGVDSAVLIAGAGHVRRDRGVPWHLQRRAPGKTVAALAFAEVGDDRDGAGQAAARALDFVWFTPRIDDEDPCAKFAPQLRRLRPP